MSSCGVRSPSCVARVRLNFLHGTELNEFWYIAYLCDGETQFLNCMVAVPLGPEGRGKTKKKYVNFKNLLYSQKLNSQTVSMVIMSIEPTTQL